MKMPGKDWDGWVVLFVLFILFCLLISSGCATRCDNPRSMACMSADEIQREVDNF